MALFYLQLRRGDEPLPNDHEAEEHADLAQAKAAAREALREIAADALMRGEEFDYSGIDITDLDGPVLGQRLASEALAMPMRRVASVFSRRRNTRCQNENEPSLRSSSRPKDRRISTT